MCVCAFERVRGCMCVCVCVLPTEHVQTARDASRREKPAQLWVGDSVYSGSTRVEDGEKSGWTRFGPRVHPESLVAATNFQ